MVPILKVKNTYECWKIVREETEKYQELANQAIDNDVRERCLAIRNALDYAAQRIMHGDTRER